MSWEIVDVERMSAGEVRKWRRRLRTRRAGKKQGRPRVLTDEERIQRPKQHRAKWAAENPERNRASKRQWEEENPGYHAQWMRDYRAEWTDERRQLEREKRRARRAIRRLGVVTASRY